MLIKRFIVLSTLILICFCCNPKERRESVGEENIPIMVVDVTKRNCDSIDENKIFNDTTWFLPYSDADIRDTLREVFEEWKFRIDEGCDITLTLYKDSTYRDNSPCEWDFAFTGFYQYVCDTLYCIRIDISDHSTNQYEPPKVICLEKYVRQNNSLKYIWRKEKYSNNKFYIQKAPNQLSFELVKRSY